MRLPLWLLKWLPLFDYICPRCKKEVSKNSHECPHCGERFPFPLRVPPKCLQSKEDLERYVHEKIFPKLSSWQRDYLAQFFTIIHQSGFDTGDFSEWTGTYELDADISVVTTGSPHHGSYHAKITKSSTPSWARAYCYKNFAGQSVAYARLYFKYVTAPATSGGRLVFSWLCAGPGLTFDGVAAEIFNDAGTIKWRMWYYTGSWQSVVSATPTPTANTWYCVEILFKYGAGTSEARTWIDGVERMTATGFTYTISSVSSYVAGLPYGTTDPLESYVDCAVVADAYIGPEAAAQLIQVTDSLSLSDSALTSKTFTVADQIGLSEATLRNWSPQIIDAVALSDSVLVNKVLEILDTVGLFDLADKLAPRAVKTRIFLIIGDLAIQLTGGE